MGTGAEVVVPSVIDGHPVVSIAKGTFSKCSNISKITIPNEVHDVSATAFSGLTSLSVIDYHDTLITLEGVENCGQSGNTQWIIGTNKCFYMFGNGTISDYTSSSTRPWKNANCTSATILDGITGIGDYTFYSCSSLIEVKIPNSLLSIGNNAFSYCSGLTSISLPDHIISIENNSFISCNAKRYSTPDSDSAKALSRAGYSFRASGDQYVIKYILDGEIISEIELVSVDADVISFTVPDNITRIGASAFYNCNALTEVVIPDHITVLPSSSFSGCTNLNSITYQGVNMILEGVLSCGTSDGVNWITGKNKSIYFFGSGRMSDYTQSNSLSWETADCTKAVIMDGVKNIG